MDGVFITAFIVCAGLLIRLHRENEKLVRARRRTAAIMRRVRRDRDAHKESFQAAVEVCKEEVAKNAALTEELTAYWDEEKRAERRVWS
jgi:hypothetical protein